MTTHESETAAREQFPIIESFTQDAPANPHWKILGSARLNGSLELTPNAQSQAGTAFLDQPFSSSLGVTIDFDYSCEGGGGMGLGDGFSVYLIDGEQTTGPGGRGGALGYSFTKSGSNIVADGVTAGYVGIGFDNFGNFASPYAGTGVRADSPTWWGYAAPAASRRASAGSPASRYRTDSAGRGRPAPGSRCRLSTGC